MDVAAVMNRDMDIMMARVVITGVIAVVPVVIEMVSLVMAPAVMTALTPAVMAAPAAVSPVMASVATAGFGRIQARAQQNQGCQSDGGERFHDRVSRCERLKVAVRHLQERPCRRAVTESSKKVCACLLVSPGRDGGAIVAAWICSPQTRSSRSAAQQGPCM